MSSLISERALNSPQKLVLYPPITDEEFDRLCAENEGVRIERTSEGAIFMNPPTVFLTGNGNAEIITQLQNWWKSHRCGRVIDSNTHFVLPDTSIKSPDAAYISPEQLKGLTLAELSGKAPFCPVFVVELLSETDSYSEVRNKMLEWQKNGTLLGWLIDPYKRVVHISAAGCEPRTFHESHLAGEGPVAGFVLDLSEVYHCYEV
jgi:Uma2 family endonuclease